MTLRVLILLLSFALTLPALSQSRVLSPTETAIELSAGSGRLVRFSTPAVNFFVANPGVVEVQPVSPSLAYLTGTAPGVTDVFAVDLEERLVGAYKVTVREDANARARLNQALTQPSGLSVEFAEDTPIVRGQVRDVSGALDAAALSESLTNPAPSALNRAVFDGPNQINLRVRFAEVSRSEVNALGINFDALANIGNFAFGLATGSAAAGLSEVAGGFTTAGDNFGAFGFGFNGDRVNADAILDALARSGAVQILAEPTLTTVNGRTARFLAGGEFPFPVAQDGSDTFTVEFREFGVSLEFTPTLLPGGRIALDVRPEVSSLSAVNSVEFNGSVIPGLTVRRAATTVELASGQSFAIAGLFQRELLDNLSGVPGVQDVPVLGALFRSRRFTQNETELVILITPYLVGGAQGVQAASGIGGGRQLAGFMLR
ncbi:MAG: type II and III secretion system protein family protein [Pseudomonadota bacterium]